MHCPMQLTKGGFTRQSNAGDGFLQPANDGGNIQHQLVRSAQLKTAHVAFLPAKTVSSSFTGHRILTTISKNRNDFFFRHNNYYCFKAASHDSQMLVIITSKRPTTWRRRCLDHSHVLGKKVIILPSIDDGASGQLKACQYQCKIVLKFCLKQ